jgi:predicted short-subunit dehydrogenase-like oxidoreductase (DUF2520 family)
MGGRRWRRWKEAAPPSDRCTHCRRWRIRTPRRIASAAKAEYHAGAVVAGNYAVVLAGLAARLAREAGVPADLAERIYLPLMAGAVENLTSQTPAQALTGPVRRGDAATIKAHLAALNETDRRVYVMLAREALRLAREAGLDPAKADVIVRLLGEP